MNSFLRRYRGILNFRALPAAAGLLLFGIAVPGAHAQNLITNGGFETSLGGNWNSTGNASVMTYSSVSGFTGYQDDGSHFLTFNYETATPNAYVAQTFATTAGSSYTVTYLYGNWSGTTATVTQSVLTSVYDGSYSATYVKANASALNSSSALLGSLTDTATVSAINTNWQNIYGAPSTLTFTALSSSTTLVFHDTAPNTSSTNGALDNVAVTLNSPAAVPEPGMIVFGLSMAGIFGGGMLRGRKKRAA